MTENINQEKQRKNFLRKMWITKESRFNCYRRQELKHNLSTITLVLLSFFVIMLNLLPYYNYLGIENLSLNHISTDFYSVLISIFIIMTTIYESSQNYMYKADKLHHCALEIGKLYSKLEKTEGIEKVQEEYELLIDRTFMNHRKIDYEKTLIYERMQNKEEPILNNFRLFFLKLKEWFFTYLPYFSIVIASIYWFIRVLNL